MNDFELNASISNGEATEYRGLLSAAFNAASSFNGSTARYDLLMNALILMEQFIRERCGGKASEEAERHFAECVGMQRSVNTISALLDHASAAAYNRLSQIDGLNDLLNTLSESGAVIDHSDEAFVLSDEGVPARKSGITPPKTAEIEKQPRLALLIRELQTIGIYTDDLILHVGTIPEHTPRKLPYVVVDIPRLKKQVAVWDQYGEITFVSQKIIPSPVWASRTKSELKALKGIDTVRFGVNWASRVCTLLESTASPAVKSDPDLAELFLRLSPPAPDLGDWRTNAALTMDRIYLSVAETYAATGEPPRADSGIVAYGPLKGLLTWKNVDQEIKDEYRNTRSIAAYLSPSLAKFCDDFGFRSTRGRTSQATPDSEVQAGPTASPEP